MAAMADGITSTDDLPPYVLDWLFDRFSDESLSDVDDRNNNDVGELSDRAGGKTDTDNGSIFDGYSDVSDDECDSVNTGWAAHCTITVLSLYYHCTINAGWCVVSFLLEEKGVCESVNMQSLIGIGLVAVNVLANIQMNTSVIYV